MIHIKVIKLKNIKRILAAAAIIFAAFILINSMSHINYVQAFSREQAEEDNQNSIYRIIMNKALPVLDAYGGNKSDAESSQFIAYTLLKYVIKVDISNPKTYLKSQMPLLGIFDVPEEFTANVSAQPGKAETPVQPDPPKAQPETNGSTDVQPVSSQNLDYNKPAVVVFHTHTSEAYTPTEKFNYVDDGGVHKTRDKSVDVCRVGEELKSYVEKYYGMAVIHDTTVHDQPSYSLSYKKARVTLEALVKKYPDAKMFIDLHRDAEVPKDKITVSVKDQQAGKVMFVIGKNNPHWQENYQLSLKLNNKIEELFPKMTRSIDVNANKLYNQDISNRLILLEAGGDTNTLEEVIVSAKLIGQAIGELLK